MKNRILILLIMTLTLNSLLLMACGNSGVKSEKTDNSSAILNTENSKTSFTDVEESDWFYSDVNYVKEKGLMRGTDDTHFSPDSTTTRGMIVAILWRLEGAPVEGRVTFSDVASDDYYYNAVAWASEHQIVSGYSETTFAPDDTITREQLATILYRYAKYKKVDVTTSFVLEKFTDKDEISDYAVDAMNWANYNGIIEGTDSNSISPKDTATRCQVAAILKRLCENILTESDSGKTESGNAEDNSVESNEEKPNDTSFEDSKTETVSGIQEHYIGTGGGSSGKDEVVSDTTENTEINRPEINVNTVYGNPGDKVTVTLDLLNNPGILGMVLSLEYDETAMSLLDVQNGEALEGILTLTTSQKLNSGVRFVWDGLDIEPDKIIDGTMLTLEFELSADALPGKRYHLMVKCNAGDVVDVDLKEINPMINQGYIEIEDSN